MEKRRAFGENLVSFLRQLATSARFNGARRTTHAEVLSMAFVSVNEESRHADDRGVRADTRNLAHSVTRLQNHPGGQTPPDLDVLAADSR
jgi:hypothetical protein